MLANKILIQDGTTGPFFNRTDIISVDLRNTEFVNNSMYNVFYNCQSLNYVTNVNQNITNMYYTFSNCYNLGTAPNIPNSVTDLRYAFCNCNKLTLQPLIPNSVSDLNHTFYGCSKLTTTSTLPNSIINMSYTFFKCNSMTSAPNIPDSVTDMSGTFYWCNSMTSAPNIPDSVTNMSNTFSECSKITSAPNIPNSVINMSGTFSDCYKLTTAPIIPNSVTNMHTTFYWCNSLVDAPEIPNSVTNLATTFRYCRNIVNGPSSIPSSVINMYMTFDNCSKLNVAPDMSNATNVKDMTFTFYSTAIVEPPIIPNSVTTMEATFMYCRKLINAPIIPEGVTSVSRAFEGCNSLVTAPNIPSTVITICPSESYYNYGLFSNCTNLTGNIYILSNKISYANKCFLGTSLTKNVYIPFYYDNGVHTQTYNAFINAGYTTGGSREGVYLKDIDIRITINPTPNDATIRLFDRNSGTTVNFIGWDYTNTGNDYEIQTYTGSSNTISVPSTYIINNTIKSENGHVVEYIVSKEGYKTVTNTITVNGAETINVNLEQIMCTFTINPTPADATVTLTSNAGSIHYYGWKELDADAPYCTLKEYPEVGDTYYYAGYTSDYVPEPAGIVQAVNIDGNDYTFESERDTCVRWAANDRDAIPQQSGNSITVPWGTEVTYTISKTHYQTVSGTYTVKTTGSISINLDIEQHTFTVIPTPNDAIVEILVNGQLTNGLMDDWEIIANNTNGDIQLQNYIGTSDVVTIPTSYTTTNTITADYGSEITYKVHRINYKDSTETTITLTEDTTVSVTLDPGNFDVTYYDYTLENNTLTLDRYYDEDGENVVVPTGND